VGRRTRRVEEGIPEEGKVTDIWFISDTHFFHDNILKFKDNQGKIIRNFSHVDEMNECMLENWNACVKPQDKVYHLGDVAVGVKRAGDLNNLLHRLNGHKRLMLGNHDHSRSPGYDTFEKIELWTGGKFKKDGFVACHIPLRHDQMRHGEFNVHGHIHQNSIDDPRYVNVCVEHTGYKPVHMDEIKQIIKNRS
jgi:calcineurin-like phosphoesterase family protein